MLIAVDPFIRAAAWTRNEIRGTLNHYILLVGVSRDNVRLQTEIGQLKIDRAALQEKNRQSERANKLLGDYAAVDAAPHVARVIAYDPFAQFQMVTLDQGSEQGIQLHMVALGTGGVVGQVIRVGANTSQVLLLSDPNSAIDGVLATSRARVIVRGLGARLLEGERSLPMTHGEFFEEGKEIVPGDQVLTSGLDGIFPRGLLIGKVMKNDGVGQEGLERGSIVPAVDIAKLEEVFLVKPRGEAPGPVTLDDSRTGPRR